MARPLRIEIAGGVYHVTTRGWERRDVVRDDDDRTNWLRLLDRVALRFGWRVFAWVLMSNHWHLFVSTPEPNLSRGMHDLSSGYATVFNRRHRRSGALFQGRFKAILVQEEGYAWVLSRYVHLNPVRAAIVKRPHQYRWSSYRDYVDSRNAPAWLDWHAVLGQISTNRALSRQEYIRFVEAGLGRDIGPSPLDAVIAGSLLGSPSWVDQMKARLGSLPAEDGVPARRLLRLRPTLSQVETAVCGAWGAERSVLSAVRRRGNDARMAAVYLARECAAIPVTELATNFGGVSPSAISRLIARAAERRRDDRRWDRRLRQLTRQLHDEADKFHVKT
jgi:REP element-mobilizing transposase RayT